MRIWRAGRLNRYDQEAAMKHMRIAVIMLALLSGLHPQAWAGVYKAPLEDVMLLPQYCWGQYDDKFQGPQYTINRPLCGPGMNHYCPGLLEYQKAQLAVNRGRRIQHLKVVMSDIQYTLRWMKDYPACPIRADVLQMQNRVRMDLGMAPLLNQTPPPVAAPQIAPDTSGAETAQGNSAAPGSAGAQGSGQGTSTSGEQLYPPPKIPPRDDSKIGMPGDPYCRFCPD